MSPHSLGIVLFCVGTLSFLAFIYPYLLYPLLLKGLPAKPYGPVELGRRPPLRAALLFCAYNEERALPEKIENIRKIKRLCPELQCLAYADCCTDRSVELLRNASDVVELVVGTERAGKATGMRILVASTAADILVFTDANVIVEPESIPRLIAYFNNEEIGSVAGTLNYTNAEDGTTAKVGASYWRLEETIKRRESETGSTMGADGSIYATRRSLYPTVPADLLDDLVGSITPLFNGLRVVSAADVQAFERTATDSRDEFRRKRRIACRAFNTHRYLTPQLRGLSFSDRFKYTSHKLLRWLSLFFALGSLLGWLGGLTLMTSPLLSLSISGIGGMCIILGYRLHIGPVCTAVEMLRSIVAVGLGVLEALLGRDYKTWTPPASRS